VGPGTNIIGVEIHQNAGNSSDLGFDLELDGDGYVLSPTNAPVPVASNDVYLVVSGTTLNVAAPGVLANDTPLPLTTVLASGAAHGALNLFNNGAFNYTPTGSYTGLDVFTYRAVSGSVSSAVATVSITVVPVPTLSSSSASNGWFSIAWPTNAPGYQLYWSPTVGVGAVWNLVNASGPVSNGIRNVTIPTTNPTAFFQLRNP